ncbi:MAG: preprotein translocase subunit SecE [Saprospiraceae bacterium]|jgi:preprotein translocase subunit SecE|nr:preprotein translocase subunit SecE [Saprospiraceae bacterium]MDP4819917.1 preprotein translocase subunit SecE [Saprospiraceae bacterium]MDP4998018.1 preprotein translocase subunit SecE [Saprospiraceae bacterium]
MDRIKFYVLESYNELINKVTWPTWPNLYGNTIVVIVASLIFALLIVLMDVLSKGALTQIYGI